MNPARSRKLLSVVIATWCTLASVACADESPTESAGSLGNQAIGAYGTKEGLNTRLFNPLMSGSVPLATLDESKQGDAQLSCPSSERFMEILLQPGPSGDINTCLVNQDTDFDGALDYSYGAPFSISGVCANGVIACSPGTWTNCIPYVWTSDGTGKVTLQATVDSDMKQCFCVNASCGSNLVLRNLEVVLKSIGGGVVAAIHRNNNRYVISDVKIDGAYAQYFGQDSAKCSTATAGGLPEQYFSNPGSFQGAVQAAAESQAGDPASYYAMLTGVAGEVQSPLSLRQCTMTKAIVATVDPGGYCHMQESTVDTCAAIASDPDCSPFPRDETIDGVTTIRNYVVTGLYPQSSCRSSTTMVQASCNYRCPGDANWAVPCLNNPVCVVGSQMAVCSNAQCPLDPAVPCSAAPTCMVGGQAQLCQVQNPVQEAVGGWSFGISVAAAGNMLHFYSSVPTYLCADDPSVPCTEYEWGYGCDMGDGTYGTCYYDYVTAETGHVTFAPGTTVTALVEGPNYLYGWAFNEENRFGVNRGLYGAKVTFTITGARVSNISSDPYAGLYQSTVSTNGTSLFISGVGLNRPTGEHWMTGSVRFDFSPDHCPLPNATACGGTPPACYETCQNTTCKDWWVKQRTYSCVTGGFDFSEAKKRVATIKNSVQDNVTSMYYRDYRQTDGGWQYEDKSLAVTGAYRPAVDSCEKACKTRKLVDNTETTIAAKKDDLVVPTTYQFFYRKCTDTGCPVSGSEEIVKDCQCINEFAEAAVIMQSLRQAGKDVICSSGQKVGLH